MADTHSITPPRAVIFDMDGLIFDTERLRQAGWVESSREFGFDLSEETFRCTLGKRKAEVHEALLEAIGTDFPVESIRKVRDAAVARIIERDGVPVKAGLFELLDFLDEVEAPKAVATSSHRQVTFDLLKRAGILHRFDEIICGDQVAHSKPHPEIFETAAEALGVSSGESVVLEDSESGIIAAHKAGMRPVHVRDILEPSTVIKRLSVYLASSLHDVRGYLSNFFGGTQAESHEGFGA